MQRLFIFALSAAMLLAAVCAGDFVPRHWSGSRQAATGGGLFGDDDDDDSAAGQPGLPELTLSPPLAATPHLAAIAPRQVIYSGQFAIVTADVDRAVADTKRLAERMGGYMQRMTRGSIVIRVPAGKFDQAVAELEKLGTVTDRDVQANDVTEEYTDLQIRLNNARALLEKLRGLLQKAKDVKEALAVEKELARVRTEAEKLQGKLNWLKNRVAFATLAANFTPLEQAPKAIKAALPFWWLRSLGLEPLTDFEQEVYQQAERF